MAAWPASTNLKLSALVAIVSVISACQSPITPTLPSTQPLEAKTSRIATHENAHYLSDLESAIIAQHNLLRADPAAYAENFLVPLIPRYQGEFFYDAELHPGTHRIHTHEGIRPLHEAITYVRAQRPLPPLQISYALSQSAQDHAKDQRHGQTGHISSTGETLLTRVNRYSDTPNIVAENIAYGQATPRRIINGLLIDDGVKNRSHRALLFHPAYQYIGVSSQPHRRYGIVTVLDYADKIDY